MIPPGLCLMLGLAHAADPYGFGPGFSEEDLAIARQATRSSFDAVTPELLDRFDRLESSLDAADQSRAEVLRLEDDLGGALDALEALILADPASFEALLETEAREARAELDALQRALDRRGAPVLRPLVPPTRPRGPGTATRAREASQPALRFDREPEPAVPVDATPRPVLSLDAPPSRPAGPVLAPAATPDLRRPPATAPGPALQPADRGRYEALLARAEALAARSEASDDAEVLARRLRRVRAQQPATRLLDLQHRAAAHLGRAPLRLAVGAEAAPALRGARPVQAPADDAVAPTGQVAAQPAAPPPERTWGQWAWDGLVWAWAGVFGGR